jgi:transposase
MRGHEEHQEEMFSYVSLEKRVPNDHPLRRVREMTDRALRDLSPRFDGLYAEMGRPSIPPEQLLRALLLQALFSVRSERQLMEQLDYNLLYRWFVGLRMDEAVWDVTVFTKNRDRLLQGEIAEKFFEAVLGQAKERGLLSDEHFTVDGTLIEAWASRKSFQEKKDPPERGTGSGGRQTLRDTHESRTDPEARLYKRSRAGEAKPSYLGHVVMENRSGLIVRSMVTQSGTREETLAALAMLREIIPRGRVRRGPQGRALDITVGADKAYQVRGFIEGLRELGVLPHVAEYDRNLPQWPNCLTAREREHPGFAISQLKRKLIEKIFGWIKFVAGLRKTKFRGRRRVGWSFCLAATAANLIRMAKLIPNPA